MTASPRWTKSKARLRHIRTMDGGNYNWLFLPGGPGLGSESLNGLTEHLSLPGSVWHLDLPGDGSNIIVDDINAYSNWSQALIEATLSLENVILVAHSLGGMFALSTPELEACIKGLVLISSAPDASFRNDFAKYVENNPIQNIDKFEIEYITNPTDKSFKELTIAYAPYVSTEISRKAIVSMMEVLPFNNHPYVWAENNFKKTYARKWIPTTIPVLIFAGDEDYLTPIEIFRDLPEFQRKNISIKTIPNASHFPWIENPESVREVFEEYCCYFR